MLFPNRNVKLALWKETKLLKDSINFIHIYFNRNVVDNCVIFNVYQFKQFNWLYAVCIQNVPLKFPFDIMLIRSDIFIWIKICFDSVCCVSFEQLQNTCISYFVSVNQIHSLISQKQFYASYLYSISTLTIDHFQFQDLSTDILHSVI